MEPSEHLTYLLKYRAIMDNRTCAMCAFWHGKVFAPGAEIPLPAHPGCRCTYDQVDPAAHPTPTPIDWDAVPAETRGPWIAYVAWLIMSHKPIPWALVALVAAALALLALEGEEDPPDPILPPPRPRPSPTPNANSQATIHNSQFTITKEESHMDPPNTYRVDAPLQLQATADGRRQYSAILIRAGQIRAQGNVSSDLVIPATTLQQALADGLFAARPTFVDHAGALENPSLQNMAGITLQDATWDETYQGIRCTIRLYDTPAGRLAASILDQMLADLDDREPVPDVGLSAVIWPAWAKLEPGADPGPALGIDPPPAPPATAEDDNTEHQQGEPSEAEGDDASEPAPTSLAADADAAPLWMMTRINHVESIDFVFEPGADGRILTALSALSANPVAQALESLGHSDTLLSQGANQMPDELNPTAPPAQTPPADATDQTPQPDRETWLSALRHTTAETIITASELPEAVQSHLRSQTWDNPQALQDAIDSHRHMIAELAQDDIVQLGPTPPRGGNITLGRTSMEQLESALEALVAGTQPPTGVQPLTGVRELYHLLSGDYEMHGLFQPDRIHLANVTSSTMANVCANVLNKVVVNMYAEYPRWWEALVTPEDFANLQQVKWITLGGVGELPTVAEGATYTELTWDDSAETADFVKKGGYLGLTLEAIDKDDTRRLRAAPRALAQGAYLTLGKAVSAIFTDASGTGPTMADGDVLFHSNHSNLGSSALSWSSWGATRIAMMKQTEVNSSERLGALTAPKYALVPIDLEITALQILASQGEPGTSDNDENPFADGNNHGDRMRAARDRVIVNPLWTDTDNWAAIADPRMYPSIGIGYRYGRNPEIFSVASPTAGLMFTNDTLPIKVRFFFAVGPTDYRGMYKHNV